ncbi:MAG: CCA tRNA nucleotidyltransferase [Gemmatimonadota bacterium]
MELPDSLNVPPETVQIVSRLEEAGFEAWCVGGALRDALLNAPEADFDIATSATPEQVQQIFRRTVPVGIQFGTVGVLDEKRRLHEVTTFRRDVTTDGRRAVVAYGVSIEEDLARRDFTINALAYHPLRQEWRDPFDGRIDLARRKIKAVGEPLLRFQEDYLRILRCARFAGLLEFTVVQSTWEAAVAAAPGLRMLSAERVRDEWFKSLNSTRSLDRLCGLWSRIGAAPIWIPELLTTEEREKIDILHNPRERDVPRDPVLLTALLCHHPVAVLTRLKASNAEIARAEALEQSPATPASADPVDVRRWLAQVGDSWRDLAELWRLRRGNWPLWASTGEVILQRGEPVKIRDLAITGEDLIAAGFEQGPRLGRILQQLLTQVIEDPGLNTPETLLRMAKEVP